MSILILVVKKKKKNKAGKKMELGIALGTCIGTSCLYDIFFLRWPLLFFFFFCLHKLYILCIWGFLNFSCLAPCICFYLPHCALVLARESQCFSQLVLVLKQVTGLAGMASLHICVWTWSGFFSIPVQENLSIYFILCWFPVQQVIFCLFSRHIIVTIFYLLF